MIIRRCKYDNRIVCTADCDREICEFRFGEDRFYKKGERPRMKPQRMKPYKPKSK